MMPRIRSFFSGIQALTLALSVVSLWVYFLTVLWPFTGRFGVWWSDALNRGFFGDSIVWMLSLSAVMALGVIVCGEITHKRSKTLLAVGGIWCIVWLTEFLFVHRFVVVR
jgi:hypothetical protein